MAVRWSLTILYSFLRVTSSPCSCASASKKFKSIDTLYMYTILTRWDVMVRVYGHIVCEFDLVDGFEDG